MCTALIFHPGGHYFGRNLDYEHSFGESLVILPRRAPLSFCCQAPLAQHLALMGVARVEEKYPLFFDAANEAGLAMAGLNFPASAVYFPPDPARQNVSPFELIAWVLTQCETLAQARDLLADVNLVNLPFCPSLPLSPLHWFLADQTGALVVESTADGLHLLENPAEVLTNEPPLPQMLMYLSLFRGLSPLPSENCLSPRLNLPALSRGLGAFGLPGDASSPSRFVRAFFVKETFLCPSGTAAEVQQCFHLLDAVRQTRGSVRLEGGPEYTRYSICCDLAQSVYYYTTDESSTLRAIDLHREDLDGTALIQYPITTTSVVKFEN